MGAHASGHTNVPTLQEQAVGNEAEQSARPAAHGENGMSAKKKKANRPKGTGCIFKPNKSRFFWIKYQLPGKRGKYQYESTKSVLEGDARLLLSKRIGDVAHGVTPDTAHRLTIEKALQHVVDKATLDGRRSIPDTERRIDLHLLPHFGKDRLMSSITPAEIEDYQTERIKAKAARATVNLELAVLRRAFRLAVRRQELAQTPYIGMLPVNNARQGFFEQDEFDAVLKHMPTETQAPLRFAYITGWRLKSEVLKLTVAQVDMQEGCVRLEVGTSKTGEGRTFYMTQVLRKLLEQQLASIEALKRKGVICPYVFHREDGAAIRDFRKSWQDACKDAGYPGKLFHDLRRTAVRNLERAGVPRSTAMQMVGHKTLSMYSRYAITDSRMHREGAALLDTWAETGGSVKRGAVRRFKKTS